MFCHQKIAFQNFIVVLSYYVAISTLQFMEYGWWSTSSPLHLNSISLEVFNKYISRIVKKKERRR